MSKSIDAVKEIEMWRHHVDNERRVAVYKWPTEWSFLASAYAKLNKSVTSHDASVLQEPATDFDYYAILGDEAAERRVSRRDTEFPQTTSGQIGYRIGKPGSKLEIFKSHARPLGDIYKTLQWPPGCG